MLLYCESQSLRFTKQQFVYFYGGYQGSLYVPAFRPVNVALDLLNIIYTFYNK